MNEFTSTNGLIYTSDLDVTGFFYEIVINRPDGTGAETFHCAKEPDQDEVDFIMSKFLLDEKQANLDQKRVDYQTNLSKWLN